MEFREEVYEIILDIRSFKKTQEQKGIQIPYPINIAIVRLLRNFNNERAVAYINKNPQDLISLIQGP